MFNRIMLSVGIAFVAVCAMAAEMSVGECQEKAARGDAEACWQLGRRYENGDGVRKSKPKALFNYRQAAEQGHRPACAYLAELYETGRLVGKDFVLAAKYRAKANGESEAAAASRARTARNENGRKTVDPIEVALDYILGRNGKARDAGCGIRLLHDAAKDDPTAQRVFVETWETGRLDAGLENLSDADWDLVLPWFREQYKKGRRKGGLVLGNEAYRVKKYKDAEKYWRAAGEAGLAKAWLKLGDLYFYDEENGGGPKFIRSEARAKKAYEACLEIDSSWTAAEISLGVVCLFGDQNVCDYVRAKKIFDAARKREPKEPWYLYCYGLAGYRDLWSRFWSNWREPHINRLLSLYKRNGLTQKDRLEVERFLEELRECKSKERDFVVYVRMAADKGSKPAKKFLEEYEKNRD